MTSSSILIHGDPPPPPPYVHTLHAVTLHLPGLATRLFHSPPLGCSSPMDFFLRHVDPRKWRALSPSPRSSPTHPIPRPRHASHIPRPQTHPTRTLTCSHNPALCTYCTPTEPKRPSTPLRRGGGSSGGAMTRFPRRVAGEEHEEICPTYLPGHH